MDEKSDKIVTLMEQYGGSFVKSLAQCFRHADPVNFTKLRQTFSAYWDSYAEMAKNK